MSKTLSAQYYQESKEKKLAKDIKIFLKKKKKKSSHIVVNITKNKSLLKTEKIL